VSEAPLGKTKSRQSAPRPVIERTHLIWTNAGLGDAEMLAE
jgi:hypothetical protein